MGFLPDGGKDDRRQSGEIMMKRTLGWLRLDDLPILCHEGIFMKLPGRCDAKHAACLSHAFAQIKPKIIVRKLSLKFFNGAITRRYRLESHSIFH